MTPHDFAQDLAEGLALLRREPDYAELQDLPEADVLAPAIRAALEKLDDADGAFTLALPGVKLHVAARLDLGTTWKR